MIASFSFQYIANYDESSNRFNDLDELNSPFSTIQGPDAMFNANTSEPDLDSLIRDLMSTVTNGNFNTVRRFLHMLGDAIGQL